VWASAFGKLVGYAIAVHSEVAGAGAVSWVTQLVVHEEHRRSDVGKTLLFTIWQFSDHFAWGLVTASPYAVRALEKATRRRCSPINIAEHQDEIKKLGIKMVPYIADSRRITIDTRGSRIDTRFFLDHSQLRNMLNDVIGEDKPWTMGPLEEGWEWFAFTFRDQPQIQLSRRELEQMLLASDAVTKHAYSRMAAEQPWAKHTEKEIEFIIKNCNLKRGDSVLDFGCGSGRHAVGLARKGLNVTAVDYLEACIDAGRLRANSESLRNVTFELGDCRRVDLHQQFDAGICLYDVIGSFAEENDNFAILENLVRQIKPRGFVLLSVMNMELTERKATNWFTVETEPDRLLTLPASNRMERTGEVFNPDFYLIDHNTRIVYRKEQFMVGEDLPEELVVRDRRFTQVQIERMCGDAGLRVIWSRFVRSGSWDPPLQRDDDRAKEILVLCQNPREASGLLFRDEL
jgi:2-polyprenyl-3-methyl-5-hydroxy-6-metoxy-1,4-benzoquinol methylase